MSRLTALIAVVLLVFAYCGLASADCSIQGYVYFGSPTDPDSFPALCSDVHLYGDSVCTNEITWTTVDGSGFYQFTRLQHGNYWVKAHWGDAACAECTGSGPECDEMWSD